MARQPITDRTDPLEMWDRIRKAIYGAGVSRHEVMLHLPTCHRKNCHRHNRDDVDLVFRMFTDVIAESVLTELLCEAVTTPDLGPDVTECATLQDRMAGGAGPWSECEHHTRSDWLDEATRAETQLGYWDWVRAKHDLRYGLSRDTEVPLAVTRDEQAYATWWANLPERHDLDESVTDLSSTDAVVVAESLHDLMLGVFQQSGPTPWLTVTGLARRADISASLDIDPAYDGDGVLDGVNVVLTLRATVGERNIYQTIKANVDRPHRDLVPPSLDDTGVAIGKIIDRAADLITAEITWQEQFWRAVR